MSTHGFVGLLIGLALIAPVTPVGAGAPTEGRLIAGSATASDFVADVVGPYLSIQTALVNDDLAPVAAAAKSLAQAAKALGVDGESLAAAATRTGAATTLDVARAAFANLSTAIIDYADRTKQPVEGKIVAFCPMANKSWVQSDGAIANPYYGQAMVTCGSRMRKLSPTQ